MLRCPSEYLQMVRDGDFGSRGRLIVAGGDYTISIGGDQPDTGAPGATGHFHVDGLIALPE